MKMLEAVVGNTDTTQVGLLMKQRDVIMTESTSRERFREQKHSL